jgi:hypothetical protein
MTEWSRDAAMAMPIAMPDRANTVAALKQIGETFTKPSCRSGALA